MGSKTQVETTATTLSASPLQYCGAEVQAVLPPTDRPFQLKVVIQKMRVHSMKCIWKHLCLSRERCRVLQEPCLGCQETECITASLSYLSQAQLAPHKSPLQPQLHQPRKGISACSSCSHSAHCALAGGDSKSPVLTYLNWGHFRVK